MAPRRHAIIRAAGLRDELTFTSFRHGGFTEAAGSHLTDAETRETGRHKSAKVLPRYAKRTMKQVAEVPGNGGHAGTKQHDWSEWASEQPPTCQHGGRDGT